MCRWRRALSPDAPAKIREKGIKQYFICSRNYDESAYNKMVDGVKQMDLMQSFSPLKVIAKVRAIRQEIKRLILTSCIAIAVLLVA